MSRSDKKEKMKLVVTSYHNNGDITQESFSHPIDWGKIKREIARTHIYGSKLVMEGVEKN